MLSEVTPELQQLNREAHPRESKRGPDVNVQAIDAVENVYQIAVVRTSRAPLN